MMILLHFAKVQFDSLTNHTPLEDKFNNGELYFNSLTI